jgi:hypothetical protein
LRALFLVYQVVFNGAWTAWVLLGYPRLRSLGECSLWTPIISHSLNDFFSAVLFH